LLDTIGVATAIEMHRRLLDKKGEKLGEVLLPVNGQRQADKTELHKLQSYIKEPTS
jgi:hypothetical protein